MTIDKNVLNLAMDNTKEDNIEPAIELKEDNDAEFNEDEIEHLGLFLVSLINQEKFIADTFIDPDEEGVYLFHKPMKITQLITPDMTVINFSSFNTLLKDPILKIDSNHIVYLAEASDSASEAYQEFLVESEESEDFELKEVKKTPIVNPNIVSKDKNIVSVDFTRNKKVQEPPTDNDIPPTTAA